VLKLITKEDVTPARADQVPVHRWRRSSSLVPALIAFAVVPFGESLDDDVRQVKMPGSTLPTSTSACSTSWRSASIGLYGIILGGWASNS
jgi:NADH-quinone oxidoreductase subunit H